MKVLIPYPEETVKIIQDIIGNEAIVVQSDRTVESMLSLGSDADIIATGRVPAEYIQSAKSLKMIHGFGAGIDKIDRGAVLERGDIIVCNSHVNAAEVAEYTIMLLLSLSKRIMICDSDMRKGNWRMAWGGPFPNIEIRNKTCLIVGLGNIGAEVAKRLRSFDVTIHAATRTGTSQQSELVDKVVRIDEVEESVKTADFVLLTLPLTVESKNLVDGQFISWMKRESLLVNISRGAIIDEGALYQVLKENRIGGAALDVWWDYPPIWGGSGQMPSEKYPFHELENVVLSPHRAAFSENIERDQIQFVAENILRFIRGEKPLNIVNMALGY
ncbi:MAG: 2-hydroxyacid dehydrogenase [Candidatus Thorarchaeota archaeon]|nr:2-hydroxyacid dehydrogenase [Candidatus Thorarchaeota archaeon]